MGLARHADEMASTQTVPLLPLSSIQGVEWFNIISISRYTPYTISLLYQIVAAGSLDVCCRHEWCDLVGDGVVRAS